MSFTYTCETCGESFVRMSSPQSRPNRFCSKRCKGQSMLGSADTFWDRTDRSDGPRSCWKFRGSVSSGNIGYGTLKFRNQFTYAHRVAWELAYGPIPEGKFVLHRCDVPTCCNPLHLMLGDARANAKDMVSKNRQRGGLASPNHEV